MTLANALTSLIGLPLASANGQTWVVAERSAPVGRAARSSVRKERKLSESSGDTALPAWPAVPGYSQSISMPSRLYALTACMILLMNVWRLDSDEQMVEKYCDPVHPPILSWTRFPAARPVWTRRVSRSELSSWVNSRPKSAVGRAKAKSMTSYLDQSTDSGARYQPDQSG